MTLREKESLQKTQNPKSGTYAKKYYRKYGQRLASEGNILAYRNRNFLDDKNIFFKKEFKKTEESDNEFILKERGIPDFGSGDLGCLGADKGRAVDPFGRKDQSRTLSTTGINYSTLGKKSQF